MTTPTGSVASDRNGAVVAALAIRTCRRFLFFGRASAEAAQGAARYDGAMQRTSRPAHEDTRSSATAKSAASKPTAYSLPRAIRSTTRPSAMEWSISVVTPMGGDALIEVAFDAGRHEKADAENGGGTHD